MWLLRSVCKEVKNRYSLIILAGVTKFVLGHVKDHLLTQRPSAQAAGFQLEMRVFILTAQGFSPQCRMLNSRNILSGSSEGGDDVAVPPLFKQAADSWGGVANTTCLLSKVRTTPPSSQSAEVWSVCLQVTTFNDFWKISFRTKCHFSSNSIQWTDVQVCFFQN